MHRRTLGLCNPPGSHTRLQLVRHLQYQELEALLRLQGAQALPRQQVLEVHTGAGTVAEDRGEGKAGHRGQQQLLGRLQQHQLQRWLQWGRRGGLWLGGDGRRAGRVTEALTEAGSQLLLAQWLQSLPKEALSGWFNNGHVGLDLLTNKECNHQPNEPLPVIARCHTCMKQVPG